MVERPDALTGVVAIAIDCIDPPRLADFWQRLLGGTVIVDDDGDARLQVADLLPLDFLRAPDPRSVKNRLHLDIGSTDYDRAVEQALALGATRADDVYDGDRWQVLRDPEGNEFCILRHGGEAFDVY